MKKVVFAAAIFVLVMLLPAPAQAAEEKPPQTDPTETYHFTNNVLDIYVGEKYSTTWYYQYDPTTWAESCWHEEFAVWHGGGIHEADYLSIVTYFNGGGDTALLREPGQFEVSRQVIPPPGDNDRFFQIRYEIHALDSLSDVKFFQVVDFDVPTTDYPEYADDYAWYTSATDYVWVADEDYFQNGFTGSIPSSNHGMDDYYTELWYDWDDGNLNGWDTYDIRPDHCDPAIGLQWNIGSMVESDRWTITITFWFGVPEAAPEPTVPEFPIDIVTLTSVIAVIGFIVKTKLLKKKEDY